MFIGVGEGICTGAVAADGLPPVPQPCWNPQMLAVNKKKTMAIVVKGLTESWRPSIATTT
jgi:hypothetical protein